jgi:hypothetical protein
MAHGEAVLARRTQEAGMREAGRLINLLVKIQSQERRKIVLGASGEHLDTHDMLENKDS